MDRWTDQTEKTDRQPDRLIDQRDGKTRETSRRDIEAERTYRQTY